jgi:hypothetical protein
MDIEGTESSSVFRVKASKNASPFPSNTRQARKARGAIVATRNQVILSRILAGMRDETGTKAKGRNSTNRNSKESTGASTESRGAIIRIQLESGSCSGFRESLKSPGQD